MATIIAALSKLYIGMDIHKKKANHMRIDISDHKRMTIPPKAVVLFECVSKNFLVSCSNITLNYFQFSKALVKEKVTPWHIMAHF